MQCMYKSASLRLIINIIFTIERERERVQYKLAFCGISCKRKGIKNNLDLFQINIFVLFLFSKIWRNMRWDWRISWSAALHELRLNWNVRIRYTWVSEWELQLRLLIIVHDSFSNLDGKAMRWEDQTARKYNINISLWRDDFMRSFFVPSYYMNDSGA